MIRYVAGFLFSPGGGRVLLIRKKRPARQAGLLNGIGGKIEAGEAPLDAQIREFEEETGLDIRSWQPVADLRGPDFLVHFFAAFDPAIDDARSVTDETVSVHAVRDLFLLPVVENLKVLIPIALDRTGILRPVQLLEG